MGLNSATIAVQNVLPKAQVAKGTSTELFARQFGGALASPIAQSVLSKALAYNLGPSVAAQVFQDGSAVGVLAKPIPRGSVGLIGGCSGAVLVLVKS